MFDSLFNHLGVVWTAATVGTLLIPMILLVGWRTVHAALTTPRGMKFQHALARAFSHNGPDAHKPLPVAAGRSHAPRCASFSPRTRGGRARR